jgi:uncharacterized membrane protein YtjA (UPF0391 family)
MANPFGCIYANRASGRIMNLCRPEAAGGLRLTLTFSDLPIKIEGGSHMLYWALMFLIVAIVAGILGFGGIAGAAAGIAKILFILFLIIFIVTLLMGRRRPPV